MLLLLEDMEMLMLLLALLIQVMLEATVGADILLVQATKKLKGAKWLPFFANNKKRVL